MLKWLRKNGCPWDTNSPLCGKAAMGGHLDVLQWLREQGFPWDNLVCMYAVEYEHPAVLKWARGAGCPWGKLYVHNVQWSNLDTLNWLGANGCPMTLTALYTSNAAASNDAQNTNTEK